MEVKWNFVLKEKKRKNKGFLAAREGSIHEYFYMNDGEDQSAMIFFIPYNTYNIILKPIW